LHLTIVSINIAKNGVTLWTFKESQRAIRKERCTCNSSPDDRPTLIWCSKDGGTTCLMCLMVRHKC